MNTSRMVIAILLVGLMVGCETEAPIAPDTTGDIAFKAMKAPNAATSSSSNVYTFAGMNNVGNSTLVRNNNGVTLNLKTTSLNAGHAYTVWFVIFNNPEECGIQGGEVSPDVPCNLPDLFNPAVQGDVMYGAGSLAGGVGTATFAGHRAEGDLSGSIIGLFGLPAHGIIDARKAEIHFVVRTHGPKIPGKVREQIGSFNGGCPPNNCVDVQFAVHQS